MNLHNDILKLHGAFAAAGYKLYPVGGAVRDFLLGFEPEDIDLATDALPEQIISLLSDYNLTDEDLQGKSFGVVRVRTEHFTDGIEIASFRTDISTGRRPEVKVGATIEQDVNRRDFTINALFYDINAEKVIDLVGGIEDLKNKRIMTPGEPIDRFNEDGLRVMRAVRFAARIGGYLDDAVIAAIAEKQPKLQSILGDGTKEPVAGERIWEEFQKGLKQAINPSDYVVSLIEHDIVDEIFPSQTVSIVMNSRVPEFVVAGLLYGSFAESQTNSGRRKLVNYLKHTCHLSDKQSHGVVLLMRLMGKNAKEVYEMHRELVKTSITFADAAVYLKEMDSVNSPDKLDPFIQALFLYKPTIKSADLQAEGFFDAALGNEIKRRETELFEKLVEQRTARLQSKSIAEEFQIKHAKEKSDYIENFPFDKNFVIEFLHCIKEDSQTENILEVLSPPTSRRGLRIESITTGPGTHEALCGGMKHRVINLNDGEIAVTINTLAPLAGALKSYICIIENGKLKIKETQTHIRS